MEHFLIYLNDGVCEGAQFALIALGYTLVYGIIKLINFAHGEFTMVGAYAGYFSYVGLGAGAVGLHLLSPWLGILAMVLVAGLAGAAISVVTERVAYRPLRKANRLIPLLTAIGVSYLLQNIFKFVNDGKALSFAAHSPVGRLFQHTVDLGEDLHIQTVKLAFVGITAVLMVGLWYLVMRTRFGRAMRATSQDLDAARLMGINVDRVIVLTFALGGFFAGITGILLGGLYQVGFAMGFMPGLIAFVAAVVGGIGSVPGAVLGGFLIGILRNMVQFADLPNAYRDIAIFALLILVLVVRPQGLLGKPDTEKV
jgi:branched-chain amino acid transport system permease protein